MRQDGAITLFQYWNRLRNGRPAPRRTEIEPADIKGLLADTFILERDARGEAVFRLAGTRLCATFGRELKGFAFASLWHEAEQRLMRRLTRSTFQSKSVVVLALRGTSAEGRTADFELLMLPLEGGRESPRALGAVFAVDRPFWLGSDPVVTVAMDSLRVVDPDREPLFLANRPAVEVPPLAPSDGDGWSRPIERVGGRRVRHLVVFDGGREE